MTETTNTTDQHGQSEIVCLCGSTRFKEQYDAANRRLTLEGKIVLLPGVFGHAEDISLTEEQKDQLDTLHKEKIDLADRIHVINVDGYIGESTTSEVHYARDSNTDITWYDESSVPELD